MILANLAFAAAPVAAADASGAFAIKGAGSATCAKFNEAWEETSRDLAQYGGWMMGYISAQNLHFEQTYDLAPWQTGRTLLGYLRSACEQLPPDTQIIRAVDLVLRSLLDERLTTSSTLKGAQTSGSAVIVYEAIIVRVQEQLAEEGFFSGAASGEFDAQTTEAIRRYQQANELEVTGLPDQQTLIALLTEAR